MKVCQNSTSKFSTIMNDLLGKCVIVLLVYFKSIYKFLKNNNFSFRCADDTLV